MEIEKSKLPAGLHFVATPIGAARDITLRALDVLASADIIAAEDTRTARKLLDIHGIALGDRPLIAYHDHSGEKVAARIVKEIESGRSVAYASEAGTPLLSDPGYELARAAIKAGLHVTTAPGPSAIAAALTVAGLPTDKFLFAGFAPSARGKRRAFLSEFAQTRVTLVFYESPKRVGEFLTDCVQVFGATRDAAVCRELTKKFEEITRGSLAELSEAFSNRSTKGEIVVVIDRGEAIAAGDEEVEAALKDAMQTMSLKDAVALVAQSLSLPRRKVYQAALLMEQKS